ncbi:MAG: diaminopimelate decarboxylase [Bulleidia sp.]
MKNLPFTKQQTDEWVRNIPTPFYVYDQAGIEDTAKALNRAFAWNPGFREYFAVKAVPTPAVLRLLESLGCGADCASIAEVTLAQYSGMRGERIMFSSNETSPAEYRCAFEAGAIINLDDLTQIENMEHSIGCIPKKVCVRYNPGHFGTENAIIGQLQESKFGMRRDQLIQAIAILKEKGAESIGMHAMLASCSLNGDYYPSLADELFALALEVKEKTGVCIDFIDLSGGIGIPYRPEESAVNIEAVGAQVREVYENIFTDPAWQPVLCTELGRFMTGPHGYLLTTVIGKKHTYKEYIGVDATAGCLMRPAIYGAYHHITVMGKENSEPAGVFDVVGSLCENNDKFAVDRNLPEVEIGDVLVIHDAGAHGHSMGYTYNGKLRPAEYLMKHDGSLVMIRRAQRLDDYFATLDCDPVFTEAWRNHD